MLTNKEIIIYDKEVSKIKRKCECGHVIAITNKYKRVICSICGNYVYLNRADEFRNKLQEQLKRKERENESKI